MAQAKRIFIIADFKLHVPDSLRIERRHWIKGFIRCGCDVQGFSYQNILKQFSPFKKRTRALMFGRKKTEQALIKLVEVYQPDILMILNMKHISLDCLEAIKELSHSPIFVGRDVDWHPERNIERMKIAKKMDIIIATNSGSWLQGYRNAGVPLCAFIPCPCDPDIQRPYEHDPLLQTDIIFTGKSVHRSHTTDRDRFEVVERLVRMKNASVFGTHGMGKIGGIDVFRAVSNAKIALSINAENNQRLYHSDRFINCISCGTLTLAKSVPDSEMLFRDGVEVKYFDNSDEFFELAEWYLEHEEERNRIAQAGMEKAHKEFNCTLMAQRVLELIETGDYKAPWKYIL